MNINNSNILSIILNSVNVVALISLIYTVYRNRSLSKYEKKSFWYRERVVKNILPLLDEIEKNLEEFIELRKSENDKNIKLKMKEIKEKLRSLRKKIEIMNIFSEKSQNPTFDLLIAKIEENENKFFNLLNDVSLKDSSDFYNFIIGKLYLYEKNNYKDL